MSDKLNPIADYIRAHPCKGFRPVPTYNSIGDFVSVFWKDEDAYADTTLPAESRTVLLRSMRTREVVGVKIYGVRQFFAKHAAEESEGTPACDPDAG